MAAVSNTPLFWIIVVVVVVLVVALVAGLVVARRRKINLAEAARIEGEKKPRAGGYQAGGAIALAPGGEQAAPEHPVEERTEVDGQPAVGDDAAVPRDALKRPLVDVTLPPVPEAPEAEEIESPAGRLERLRG